MSSLCERLLPSGPVTASCFLAVFFAAALPLSATAQAVASSDLNLHKFHPKTAPDQASRNASATDLVVDSATGLAPFAVGQMHALQQEKAARTAAQIKIDSNILYTERMLQGQPAAPGIDYLETGIDLDDNDSIVVDMVANVTDDLLARLQAAGASVLLTNVPMRAIRAIIPPQAIEGIAASPDVVFVGPMQGAHTHRLLLPAQRSPGRGKEVSLLMAAKAAKIRAALSQQISRTNASTPPSGQGSVETEGDLAHQAVQARATYGLTGAGLKIGVISDTVTTAIVSQGLGDLPPTCASGATVSSPCLTVLPGQAGSGTGDEGTAILEIVHDMVPGADLYFATAGPTITQFASNIRALRAAGCSIIIDDIFYYSETPMQDGQASTITSNTNGGVVTQAVNDVVAGGAFYFSSAGNQGNLDLSTSGTYEGDFNPTTPTGLPTAISTSGKVHNFGTTATPQLYDNVTLASSPALLFWADPLGGSSNDYDLYATNTAGTAVTASSTNVQSGTQDPYEQISASLAANVHLVVYQKPGAANRFFHLILEGGTLSMATSGEISGHSAGSGAYGVAATPAKTPYSTSTPAGPYPNAFGTANQIETFSSDGYRRIFFNGDSTAITAGNLSSTGGKLLLKPDVTGSDGVSVTGVGGFQTPFYGTSAAAPSAASVAALVLAAQPGLTAAQMRTALTSTAVDIMASGTDRDSGAGVVLALPAVQSTGYTGGANLEFGSITATENPGDGNGIIEAGEGATVSVQLTNATGVAAAKGISASLTAVTPGIIVKQPATITFPDMAAGAGPQSGSAPFAFTVPANFGCGTAAQFALNILYSNGQTRTLTINVPIGQVTINNTLGSTPSRLPSGVTFATGSQSKRLTRTNTASVCGTNKALPTTNGTVAHVYDSYSFASCSTDCISPSLTSAAAGVNLLESFYTPSFVPTNVQTNYKADTGQSSPNPSFGVNVTSGTNYALVVGDVNGNPPASGLANTYSVTIPSCVLKCSVYPLPNVVVKNVTVAANRAGGANASVDDGSNDPSGGPITLNQFPAGPYQLGTTNVTLTVTNKYGAFTQAVATVTVTTTSTKLAYIAGPPAYRLVGGNPGIVKVAIEDVYGNINIAANDTVTLLITGPAGFVTAPQTAAAVVGVATFNLTGIALTTAGAYNVVVTDGLLTSATAATTAVAGNAVNVLNANSSISRFASGGQPLNQSGAGTTIASGFVAIDASSVAWSAVASGTLRAMKTDGTAVILPGLTAAGVNAPTSVAVDGLGQIWVTNGNNSISELDNTGNALSPATGYTGVTFSGTGYSLPAGISIDISGNVWVSNASSNKLIQILGGAAPAAPLSTATTNSTTGVRP